MACDEWAGFVFVNVDPESEESLAEFLGELATDLGAYPFAEFSTSSGSWTTEVRANWKVVTDAFQETYHVPFLHKRSLPDSFTSPDNPHNQILDLKPHNFWPVDIDRTIWQATQYFPKARTAGQRFNEEYGHVLLRDVILEDGRTFEEIQSMLSSGAKEKFYLQDEEILVRHSHDAVHRMIEGRELALV